MIDFSRADPTNPRWWKRVRWLLDEMSRQESQAVLALQHAYGCALLASAGTRSAEAFRRATQYLDEITQIYSASVLNIPVPKPETPPKTESQELIERYYALFGRPGEDRYERMVQEWTRHFGQKAETPKENYGSG